jgi:hypothetical protein
MGITLAAVIAGLAAVGFVFGKVKSRVPATAVPRPAGIAPGQPAGMPPPASLPPPPAAAQDRGRAGVTAPHATVDATIEDAVIEEAVVDTGIFEPPPSHYAPPVIAPSPGPLPPPPPPSRPATIDVVIEPDDDVVEPDEVVVEPDDVVGPDDAVIDADEVIDPTPVDATPVIDPTPVDATPVDATPVAPDRRDADDAR